MVDAVDGHGHLAREDEAELLMRVTVERDECIRLEIDEVQHRRLAEERVGANARGEIERGDSGELYDLRHDRQDNRPVRVLTLGETMVLFEGVSGAGLVPGEAFTLRVAGAETNFAIALRRLGLEVEWISRLGRDPFGDLVLETLRSEGIDIGRVARDDAPTGAFFKWREAGENRVLYRRTGAAASLLAPGDIPDEALDAASLVHLSGITLALSESARETVVDVAARARARGKVVTFDPNYRPLLWRDPAAAADAMAAVLPAVDWVLCGLDEASLLFEVADPDRLRAAVRAAGAGDLAVRVGARGAIVWEAGTAIEIRPRRLEQVVDEIGAGDGFDAGFAVGLLNGLRPSACAHAGNVIAAHALRGTGDWETFPSLEEVGGEIFERA